MRCSWDEERDIHDLELETCVVLVKLRVRLSTNERVLATLQAGVQAV